MASRSRDCRVLASIDRGDSNSGPRAKVIALDMVRQGLSSSVSALVVAVIVARVACGGMVAAELVSVGIPPAPGRRTPSERAVKDEAPLGQLASA